MIFATPLNEADAALFEESVVPRYLSYFGGLCAGMLLPSQGAMIAHIGCRTGYPDPLVAEKVPQSTIVGVDGSAAALEVAKAKATLFSEVQTSYVLADGLPTQLQEQAFTHAYSLHPICDAEARFALMNEMRRLLVPGGQALLALPLRGSFPEIADMVREFALRQDLSELGKAIDAAVASRPTIETISEELENAGLTEVDVDVQLIAVSFNDGREFLEDPIARLMVFPELTVLLQLDKEIVGPCLRYVHDAISKYWSEGVFELTVNVGCASARKL
ncbi:Biotin synthesis protein BioC [Minicystis rosea]|nr:Biotin synthesis protein BioC [Minicystis rosea]